MMRLLILTLILVCISFFGFAQENIKALNQLSKYNEVELGLSNKNFHRIANAKQFDIDKISADSVFIYVTIDEFYILQKYKIPYFTIERKTIEEIPKLSNAVKYITNDFNVYPTYNQYDTILMTFENDYPQITKHVVLGTLSSGRKIQGLRISDNINTDEKEPTVLLTSSIHGNEVLGYILMLKLAKFLLEGYGVDAEATQIIDSLDLLIIPLANPDGTYYGGNNTVSQAIRYNANSIDLNRNYPDPEDGPHSDGNQYQPETILFMNLADTLPITLAANFHGGAEVLNYPWDTWAKLHADDSWWQKVCILYADSCQKASNYNGYLDDFGTGITNGYQWYTISGGRQDYMNYFHHCREVTIEISATKIIPENQLATFWSYNKRSLLDYVKQGFYGLRGVVTDSVTGMPLSAHIQILNHDIDSSSVWTYPSHGDYYRLIDSGLYTIQYSSTGYYSKTIDSVHIVNNQVTLLNVQLAPKPDKINNVNDKELQPIVFPNPAADQVMVYASSTNENTWLSIYSENGNLVLSKPFPKNTNAVNFSVKELSNGIYFLNISTSCTKTSNSVELMVSH